MNYVSLIVRGPSQAMRLRTARCLHRLLAGEGVTAEIVGDYSPDEGGKDALRYYLPDNALTLCIGGSSPLEEEVRTENAQLRAAAQRANGKAKELEQKNARLQAEVDTLSNGLRSHAEFGRGMRYGERRAAVEGERRRAQAVKDADARLARYKEGTRQLIESLREEIQELHTRS